MFTDAWAELEELRPEWRHLATVILLRVMILNNLRKWESAAIIGEGAIRHYPDFGALYLATAHACRNWRGSAEAKVWLLAGEHLLDRQAVFHTMLAAYECQLGNLEDAKAELQNAFEIDPESRHKALDDRDLAPLWDSL